MSENRHLANRAEEQRTWMEIAATPLPSLWTDLKSDEQRQIGQLLAELIRRTQRQRFQREGRQHEP
jgi:hypothetical protein